LKTLEYFGAGLPVVSTDLPGSRWLRDDLARSDPAAASQLMALASDGTGFAAAVRRLAGGPGGAAAAEPSGGPEGNPARAASARAFADRHSWPRRADALAAATGLRAPRTTDHDGRPVRV
jgi:teichuronic acid biosynthesis glycosyltransferase TuaH